MKRRSFIKTSAALSASSLFPIQFFADPAKKENKKRYPKPLTPKIDGNVKEFRLFIDIYQHEIVPGVKVHTLAFNNQIPGPEIRVKRGDKVRVYFKNKTELNHTIHWHGLHVPWRMDGVPYVTQMPVMPGQEFVYEFNAEPYGTHFYHCHWGTVLHMQAGMYGSIIMEEDDDPINIEFPYKREYTLIYSAHDINFMRNELNAMLERMKERIYLMKNGRFDKERFALFDSIRELEEAITKGYQPPYVVNRRAPSELPEANWFTVNGKSYPYTPNLYIKEGESIRVRLINAGNEEHYLHLHGHDFWLVCDDSLHFTDVLNPFSSGENTEESQFGNVLELTHIFGQRFWLRIHGEHFTEIPVAPETPEADFSLNSLGMSFEYRIPETQRWNRQVLDQIGVSFNNFITDREGYTDIIDRALKNVILSTVLNVHPDPVYFWDVRHQTIFNLGFYEITEINSFFDMTRAKSLATFTSVRYLYRRLERPTVQFSTAFGYKAFPNLSNDAKQLEVVANAFYRLAEKFDIGLQFQYHGLKVI